jgi:hypothetical protein
MGPSRRERFADWTVHHELVWARIPAMFLNHRLRRLDRFPDEQAPVPSR